MLLGSAIRPLFAEPVTFTLGHPDYLDLSIRCTTQPSFVSSATSQAEVAAAIGEEAKNDCYLDTVNDHSCGFSP